MTVNTGHGRIEWRGIQTLEVTPQQMGFPHAVQLARHWQRRQSSILHGQPTATLTRSNRPATRPASPSFDSGRDPVMTWLNLSP